MKILTAEQMQSWERRCIQKMPISPQKLMERAAQACVEEILDVLKEQRAQLKLLEKSNKIENPFEILILCGPGNNGGDGFAIASILRKIGFAVSVFWMGTLARLSDEAREFYQKLEAKPHSLTQAHDFPNFQKKLCRANVVIDALFGIGLNRPLQKNCEKIIRKINRHRAIKIAVDIPSGISGSAGKISSTAFSADRTITFECPKWGQIDPSAWDFVGTLKVKKIGLKKKWLAQDLSQDRPDAEWNDFEDIQKYFKARSFQAHKGSAGKVLILAGSAKMPGAGYLSSITALRSGAGLVTWALPREAFQKIDLRYPEVILHDLPSKQGEFSPEAAPDFLKLCSRFDAIAVGPGLGQGSVVKEFLKEILPKLRKPLVLDADALNFLAHNPKFFSGLKNVILTPHPQEMARLSGLSLDFILKNRYSVARDFAVQRRVWILLKGYRSVIASPSGKIFINASGGPNLAVAGSGDVLTGLLAAMLASFQKMEMAARAAVYLHGNAGDSLAMKSGDRGTLASEIANEIPHRIQSLIRGQNET